VNAAASLLQELAGIGASIKPAGAQLILRAGPNPIPPALVRRVREAKQGLIEILHAPENEIVRWLDQHPAPSHPGRCAWCREADRSDTVVLPFGTVPGAHAWLHARCWSAWHASRRTTAAAAIMAQDGQS
jgi:hypothetical protein